MTSINGIFSLQPETTNSGINNNVIVSMAVGIFRYQGYVRYKLIQPVIFKIASKSSTKEVAFVSSYRQYNVIFHNYSCLKERLPFLTTQNFRHSHMCENIRCDEMRCDALHFYIKAVTDYKTSVSGEGHLCPEGKELNEQHTLKQCFF